MKLLEMKTEMYELKISEIKKLWKKGSWTWIQSNINYSKWKMDVKENFLNLTELYYTVEQLQKWLNIPTGVPVGKWKKKREHKEKIAEIMAKVFFIWWKL